MSKTKKKKNKDNDMCLPQVFCSGWKKTAVSVPKKVKQKPKACEDQVYDLDVKKRELSAKIKAGSQKPTASTGKPIKDLYGAAWFTAVMSNIGGGSKAAGGGGMSEGLKLMTEYANLKGRTLKP